MNTAVRGRGGTGSRMIRRSFTVMGTTASLVLPTFRAPAAAGEPAAVVAVREVLQAAERRFSRYLPDSELERYRRGEPAAAQLSADMESVLADCTALHASTGGLFRPWDASGAVDPTGYVKGWAMQRAMAAAIATGMQDLCLNVGGDVCTIGTAAPDRAWRVAVRGTRSPTQVAAVLTAAPTGAPFAVATSGTYERGQHIWTHEGLPTAGPAGASVTVVGSDAGVVDAWATAAWVRLRNDGVAAATALVESAVGIAGLVVCDAGCSHATAGLSPYLLDPTATG